MSLDINHKTVFPHVNLEIKVPVLNTHIEFVVIIVKYCFSFNIKNKQKTIITHSRAASEILGNFFKGKFLFIEKKLPFSLFTIFVSSMP